MFVLGSAQGSVLLCALEGALQVLGGSMQCQEGEAVVHARLRLPS